MAEKFEFFWNRFDIPHCPLRFLTLELIFWKRNCRIRLLIALLFYKVVVDRNRIFRRPKFFPDEFFAKTIENRGFFTGQVLLCRNFCGLKSHVWLPNTSWVLKNETLVAFSFWPKFFWFSTRSRPEIIRKKSFRMRFRTIWSLALSACLKVVLHITWIDKHFEQCLQ